MMHSSQNIWLERAPGNEQYFGLQIVMKGFNEISVPSSPVYHNIGTESLSKTSRKKEVGLSLT